MSTAAELGHQNLIAYCRVLSQWSISGTSHDADGVLVHAGGSWLPVVGNGAFRTDDDVAPDLVVDRADAFFTQRQRGYCIKVRDTGADDDLAATCTARGLEAFGIPTPEMICHHPLAVPALPEGIELRAVTKEAGISDFIAINADAYATYGMPADVLPDLFDRPQSVLADDDTAIVIAYQGGRPVATALTFIGAGTASLQWVGTVSEARSMRLGEAVTVWATNAAFERGAPSCTLQASPMGAPLYQRLGYEVVYHYRDYVRWSAPEA